MSCFPEHVYAHYADDELSADERRPLESHLMQCRRCRELVVALREEAELLGDALREREHAAPQPAAPPAPARGIALGMGPALVAGLVFLIALGWLLETVQPAADRWIAPFTLKGATDMAFDLFFLLRDQAPAAFELGVAVAAMASVSALLTFALTMLLRRWQGPGLLMLSALLVLALPVAESRAHFGWHEHDDFTLAAGETHDGTLVLSAQTTNIDGTVAGDLISMSHRLTIRGEVQGNVIAIARHLELPGKVTGSVHAGAGRSHVTGEVAGNLYVMTEAFTLASAGEVKRDAAIFAESAVLEGPVGRDLFMAADRGELRGKVERNASLWGERMALLDGADVGGDVVAMMPRGSEVEVASGAQVGGEVSTSAMRLHERRGMARYSDPRFYIFLTLQLAAAFLTGMLLHQLLPAVYDVRVETTGAFFRTLAVGFLVLVVMPIGLGLVACTLVGIPVALMGLGVYLGALYIGAIVVAALIGAAMVHPQGEGWGPFGLALLAGLTLIIVATHAPWVGGIVRVVVFLLGLGLLAERSRRGWRALRTVGA